MDKKRYGVHNDLLQSLKDFQISLRRTTMPFVTLANVSINSGEALRLNIQAEGGRISIPEFPLGPRGLQRFRPPRQTLIEIGTTKVRIDLVRGIYIIIEFDTTDERAIFITTMGNLNEESSSSDTSSSSRDSSLDCSGVSGETIENEI
ncbi:hypothetical protein TcasGA2_TC032666 [Tribolium castaneum]|uniref:Uncharacterized protein n=1 Tax=Tribolium castaneum TaxID=7070 RepID=A0A139WK79_TRICA|nr:PREDICTED: uncharacterized protein LOC107397691 isoform X1 [Tribolium castaneum]KYB28251.1 hypothetical protein TcasGA2_TC032666 [Tribolium castaneum]|eukprot:XP_015834206.1 PREDICTED: uncharacterized protein LOC107397691 isoform X1 [Tribolium castaneum]